MLCPQPKAPTCRRSPSEAGGGCFQANWLSLLLLDRHHCPWPSKGHPYTHEGNPERSCWFEGNLPSSLKLLQKLTAEGKSKYFWLCVHRAKVVTDHLTRPSLPAGISYILKFSCCVCNGELLELIYQRRIRCSLNINVHLNIMTGVGNPLPTFTISNRLCHCQNLPTLVLRHGIAVFFLALPFISDSSFQFCITPANTMCSRRSHFYS